MSRQPAILLVEDEPSIRTFMSSALRDEGYAVVEALDGAAAVRTLDAPPAPLCLVLLDMMIPIVSGLQVLQHIHGLGSYVPVVAMSASSRHLVAATTAGASAVLAKPFELERLLALVADYYPPPHDGSGDLTKALQYLARTADALEAELAGLDAFFHTRYPP